MKPLEKILIETLHFSLKKAQIYLALLELGEADASSIAKKAGLKRTTAYNILPELAEAGLIRTSIQKGTKKFYIESPVSLETHFDAKREVLSDIMPSLEKLQGMFYKKPRITLYEGENGFKEIYKDFISSTARGGTIYSYAGTRDQFRYIPKDFVIDYAKKRIAKGIRLKLIAGRSPLSEELWKTSKDDLREVKVTDSPNFDFAGETIMYGDKIAFISYRENFLGTIIESKEIGAMHRATFELLWEKM